VFGPSDNTIPGMTIEILKDFIQMTNAFMAVENPSVIKDIFKGKHDFFGLTFPGLLEVEVEVHENGEIDTHWCVPKRSKLRAEVSLTDFDNIMLDKLAPMLAITTQKVKMDGCITEAMKFIAILPALKKPYQKARKKISQKYKLADLAK
jgi:hypothetical protein